MSSHTDIPESYKPFPPDRPNFEAPAHNLNTEQRAAVIKLAESSHEAAARGQSTVSNVTTGLPSGASSGIGSAGLGSAASHHSGTSSTSGVSSGVRDVLGGGSSSVTQTHTGQSGQYGEQHRWLYREQ